MALNYIGIGVGGILGALSQDPIDNPFSSIIGATVGGVIGSIVSQDIAKDITRFQNQVIKKAYSYKNIKESVNKAERSTIHFKNLLDSMFDSKVFQGKTDQQITGYIKTLNKRFSVDNSRTYDSWTKESIDHALEVAKDRARLHPVSTLEALEKETRGFRTPGLIGTRINPNVTTSEALSGSFDERVKKLTSIIMDNNIPEEEARQRAFGMMTALQNQDMFIEYSSYNKTGKHGRATGLYFPKLKERFSLSQRIELKQGEYVHTVGAIDIKTPQELLSGNRTIGIVNKVNILSGLLGSSPLMQQFDGNGKAVGKFTQKLITIDHAGKGYLPEDVFTHAAYLLGRPLTDPEAGHLLEFLKGNINYSASSSLDFITRTAHSINVGNIIKNDEGTLKISKTDRDIFDNLLVELRKVRGIDPKEGIYLNSPDLISDGLTRFATLDPVSQRQRGAGLISMREARPIHPSSLLKHFNNEYSYLARNSQAGGALQITNRMNTFIANKFGMDLFIADGSTILLNYRNGKNITANRTSRTMTLGLQDIEGENIHSIFQGKNEDGTFYNLLTEEFLAKDSKDQLDELRKHSKDSFSKGTLIGFSPNSLEERVPEYADRMQIKQISKTDRGIEISYDAVAGERGTFQKIFNQVFKSGGNKANERSEAIRKLVLAEAAGIVSVDEENLFMGGKQISLEEFYASKDEVLKNLWENERYKQLDILTTFDAIKNEGLEAVLEGTENDTSSNFIKSAKITPEFQTPFHKSLLERFDQLGQVKDTKEEELAARLERGTIYKYFDMLQSESRTRYWTLENMVMQGLVPAADINKHVNLMRNNEESQKIVYELMRKAHTASLVDAKFGFTAYGLEANIEIHAAGRKSTSSWLQRYVLQDQGLSDKVANKLFKDNVDAARDLLYIASTAEAGTFGNEVSQNKLAKLGSILSLQPDDRRGALKSIYGVDVAEDKLSYQLATEHNKYKSIPIVLEETARSDASRYAQDYRLHLSRLEAARKAAILADIEYRGVAGTLLAEPAKARAVKALDLLHEMSIDTAKKLSREALKREARFGEFSIARYVGGSQISAMQKKLVEEGYGEANIFDEPTVEQIRREARGAGTYTKLVNLNEEHSQQTKNALERTAKRWDKVHSQIKEEEAILNALQPNYADQVETEAKRKAEKANYTRAKYESNEREIAKLEKLQRDKFSQEFKIEELGDYDEEERRLVSERNKSIRQEIAKRRKQPELSPKELAFQQKITDELIVRRHRRQKYSNAVYLEEQARDANRLSRVRGSAKLESLYAKAFGLEDLWTRLERESENRRALQMLVLTDNQGNPLRDERTGRFIPFYNLLGREPQANSFSTTINPVVLARDLPKENANKFMYIAKGYDPITGKEAASIFATYKKLDVDADAPTNIFPSDLNREEYKEIEGMAERFRTQAQRLRPLAEALDPKASKILGTEPISNMLAIDDLERYKAITQAMGEERKHTAPIITKINQEINKSLRESSLSFEDHMLAKTLNFQMVEGLIKTSHLNPKDYEAGGNIRALSDLMDTIRGGEKDPAGVLREAYRKTFIGVMDTMFSEGLIKLSQDDTKMKMYRRGQNLLVERSYDKLQNSLKEDTRTVPMHLDTVAKDSADDLKRAIGPVMDMIRGSASFTLESDLMHGESLLSSTKRVLPGIKEIYRKHKIPLIAGGAILGTLSAINGAQTSDLPSRDIPKNNPNNQLQPRSIEKGYTRPLRDNTKYDIKVRTTANNNQREDINRFIKGDGTNISTVSVNYRTR